MYEPKYGSETITSQVLIVGGGIGGLSAAVGIKEQNPDIDVLIVEKQVSGYSGKANKGGGILQYFDYDKIAPEAFVAMHANTIGCFLGDQERMLDYVRSNHNLIDRLKSWGVKVPSNEDGSYTVHPMGPFTMMIGVDLDMTVKIRARAERLGVKIMDKVAVNDLLTNDGVIAGAIGYSILDGKCYVFEADKVILATGSQNYRIASMWSSGRGDGIIAAFRAGAQLRNPEFGNFAQFLKAKSHEEVVFGENVLYDCWGQNVTKNYRRFMEGDVNSKAIAEWYYQMSALRGPLVVHPDEFEPVKNDQTMFYLWDRPYGLPFWKANYLKAGAYDDSTEVCPGFIGEQSPVKVDKNMKTTIPGLYAIGDVCYSGSTLPGAVPAPPGRNRGSGILNAVFTALKCADDVVKTADDVSGIKPDPAQIQEYMERIYAPLERTEGTRSIDVVNRIQEAMAPVEQSVYMSEARMQLALRMVEEAKEMAANMVADDFHALMNCHEAEAMVFSAELHYKASLMRKESRGWFLREDYPEMDNENWLKWIVVDNDNNEIKLGTEDVPIENWPFKPLPM